MKYYDEENECMDRAELRKLQSRRMVQLVKYVYDNNKPYRAKMDAAKVRPSDIKGIGDIYKLPFTTKQDLRDNYPFGMFTAKRKDIVRVHASSGTTGKLTVAGYSAKDISDWADVCARALTAAGAGEESVIHIAYGYGLFTGGLGLHYGAEKLGAMAVPASSGNTQRQIMLIKDFGADVLCCTPSYALYIADEMQKIGVNPNEWNLKIGIFGAEPWSESMRREIESRLNIKAYAIYGISEICGPGVASECYLQNGCHVQEDLFYPEIVDNETLEPLPFGGDGELVFTTLAKEGMPLIRYRTRDICMLDDAPCECGRTFVRMARVYGRSDDMLIIRGVNVFPSQLENVLINFGKGIEPHYQIIVDRVENTDTLEIQVEVNETVFSDEVKVMERLKRNLQAEILSNISVSANIKFVSAYSLPRSEGKAKRVIDKRVY